MKIKKFIAAFAAASVAVMLAGCQGSSNGSDKKNDLFSRRSRSTSDTVSDYNTDSDPVINIPQSSVTSKEEERTSFDSVWDMFDYKEDKSEIGFMSIATNKGTQKLYIPTFEEQLRKYGSKAKVQTDGGLYAFDAAGATIAVIPNDDGSTDYQLCDGGVLGAALENSFMQVIKSGSSCFGMHLGTSTMFLQLQIPDIKQVESDLGGTTAKFVLERDDYNFTVYTSGGECFWFIVTVFDNKNSESGENKNNGEPMLDNDDAARLSKLLESPPKDFDYTYNGDLGGVQITDYLGEENEIKIPAKINGDPVVDISLNGEKLLTGVFIPETVKRLYINADNLKSIVIPEGVESIGLSGCSGITSLRAIPQSTKSLYLESCGALTDVKIPEGVKQVHIGHCKKITEITLPDSVTEIDYDTFSGCTALKKVNIGNGVTNFTTSAFSSKDFKDLTITYKGRVYNKDTLRELYDDIILGDSGLSIVDGKLNDVSYRLTEVVIPDDVTSIAEGAFNNCGKLEIIVLGSGIKTIPRGTFFDCTSLKSIVFGDGMTELKGSSYEMRGGDISFAHYESHFKNSPDLSAVVIGKNTTIITNNIFSSCKSLTNVTIPDSVIEIDGGAFEGCFSLENIKLPQNLITIGTAAFSRCTNLKEINIPEGVTKIGFCAFENCTSLIDVVIPKNVKSIDSYAFQGCANLTNVVIPDSVTKVGISAFDKCPSLANATYKGKSYNYAHIDDLYKAINGK